MGSGTHSLKIDGFPGTHGTHANGATVWHYLTLFQLGSGMTLPTGGMGALWPGWILGFLK